MEFVKATPEHSDRRMVTWCTWPGGREEDGQNVTAATLSLVFPSSCHCVSRPRLRELSPSQRDRLSRDEQRLLPLRLQDSRAGRGGRGSASGLVSPRPSLKNHLALQGTHSWCGRSCSPVHCGSPHSQRPRDRSRLRPREGVAGIPSKPFARQTGGSHQATSREHREDHWGSRRPPGVSRTRLSCLFSPSHCSPAPARAASCLPQVTRAPGLHKAPLCPGDVIGRAWPLHAVRQRPSQGGQTRAETGPPGCWRGQSGLCEGQITLSLAPD